MSAIIVTPEIDGWTVTEADHTTIREWFCWPDGSRILLAEVSL